MTTIYGIKHIDYITPPANVTFLEGGIDSIYVIIKIESQPGMPIDSTFLYYTSDRGGYRPRYFD